MKFRVYYLFVFAAIISFIAGMFVRYSAMDMHLNDTYIVFSGRIFAWFLSILLIGFFLLYLATDTVLFSMKLSWIHVSVTIVCIIVFLLLFSFQSNEGMAGMPRRYYDFGNDFNRYYYLYKRAPIVTIATLVFILAQLVYVLNLGVGLVKRISNKADR